MRAFVNLKKRNPGKPGPGAHKKKIPGGMKSTRGYWRFASDIRMDAPKAKKEASKKEKEDVIIEFIHLGDFFCNECQLSIRHKGCACQVNFPFIVILHGILTQ